MTTFGPEIVVDGRPAWLGDDDMTTGRKRPYSPSGNWPDPELGWKRAADVEKWENVRAFRLPADHFAYIAINNGFEPCSSKPTDWDRQNVLWKHEDGTTSRGSGSPVASVWHHDIYPRIIGYRQAIVTVNEDSVTLARMTEAEARELAVNANGMMINADSICANGIVAALRHLNLIRPETRAERFTRETGIVVTGDVLRALEWERGE